MVRAFTQFQTQTPALRAQLGRDRRIAVMARIGARDAFLAGAGVLQSEHIQLERHVTRRQGGERRAGVLEKGTGNSSVSSAIRAAASSSRCRSVAAEGTARSPRARWNNPVTPLVLHRI